MMFAIDMYVTTMIRYVNHSDFHTKIYMLFISPNFFRRNCPPRLWHQDLTDKVARALRYWTGSRIRSMRITPDVVAGAPQALNCVGARELSLRSLAIPAVENLATTRDGFDTIDLSTNAIEALSPGCFPPSPRLSSLYLGSNRIRAIYNGFADSLPSLRTLVLTDNRIETIEHLNIPELKRFRHLEVITLTGNPVASVSGLRINLVYNIPSLRFLNLKRVTLRERRAAADKYGTECLSESNMRDDNKRGSKRRRPRKQETANTFDVGSVRQDTDLGVDSRANLLPQNELNDKQGRKKQIITKENVEKLKAAILAASSIEEVKLLQNALQSGDMSVISKLLT